MSRCSSQYFTWYVIVQPLNFILTHTQDAKKQKTFFQVLIEGYHQIIFP